MLIKTFLRNKIYRPRPYPEMRPKLSDADAGVDATDALDTH